jgi:hypothetical protein
MPNGYIIIFPGELPKNDVEAIAGRYWGLMENEARQKRRKYIFDTLLWWFGSVVALYSLGWSIGWVYRGFKKA